MNNMKVCNSVDCVSYENNCTNKCNERYGDEILNCQVIKRNPSLLICVKSKKTIKVVMQTWLIKSLGNGYYVSSASKGSFNSSAKKIKLIKEWTEEIEVDE